MRLKSFLAFCVLALWGLSTWGAAGLLSAENPYLQLPHCKGTAELRYVGGTPYLFVTASECNFILNEMGEREHLDPSGYALAPNRSYLMTVTSERGDSTGHMDQFMVDTTHAIPMPEPLYPLQHPFIFHVPSVDVYDGSVVDLPSCGGQVKFHQTFFLETPQLTFSNVTECTYYNVLSAAPGAEVLDATEARLQKDVKGWSGQFDLPNRWGTNKVRVRLQSHSNEHAVDIFVHFVTK